MTAINNRYEFVYFFDVENGNPNGDPDAGNMPRIDPETGHGLVTDVCLKRKIRNYVEIAGPEEIKKISPEIKNPYIYVKEKSVLSTRRAPAYEAPEVKDANAKGDKVSAARQWMCHNFFDVRTFGAVMSTKENNCGQVRGPVQLSFAKSIDPIVPSEVTITRMAVETESESKAQDGDNRTMGRKHIVPYALYRAEGYVSAHLANGEKGTGFSNSDLHVLWQALGNMFDHDHSAARGKMNARRLIVFKHESPLGNAPAHKLFDAVTVGRKNDSDGPARTFSDYVVEVDESAVPQGVNVEIKF